MDIEKIIKGLHCCAHTDGISCVLCPYDIADEDCTALMSMDVLDLLKEQEPKTGAWQWKIHGKPESGGTLGEAICDQCGKSTYATAVKGDLNYCPNCGAKMEGR